MWLKSLTVFLALLIAAPVATIVPAQAAIPAGTILKDRA